MIFGSPRQALAYLYAHHRGPTLARPKYHDAPGDTGRSHWDGAMVGAMLYGPRLLGHCGVTPGSALDRQLRHWATTSGVERSGQILAVERRMRCVLRSAGMLVSRRTPAMRRWKDPEGDSWMRVVASSRKITLPRCPKHGNKSVASVSCVGRA